MKRRFTRFLGVLLALASVSCADESASPSSRRVQPIHEWASGVDTIPGEYTRVVRVAEMADSTLVFGDAMERQLWRVNAKAGTREVLGRRGAGPGEYQRVGFTVKVHRDSVALPSGTAGNPIPVISAATGTGRTHSLMNAIEVGAGLASLSILSSPLLQWADTMGRLYGAPTPMELSFDERRKPTIVRRDTVPIVRYSMTTGDVDTLAQFAVGQLMPAPSPNPNGTAGLWLAMREYGAYNNWKASADGRIVIVDAARYVLRVLDESGAELHTWQIPYTAVDVSEEGWQRYVDSATKNAGKIAEQALKQIPNRGTAPMIGPPPPHVPPMPRTLPPVAFNGELQRNVHWHGDAVFIPVNVVDPPGVEHWDIVNVTTGSRLATVSLPPRHRIIHAGEHGVYVVHTDDDDLERILRFRVPSSK